ncbi:MAG TPA: DUF3775 domain-containing protein [Rhizomicrobium sp.]|nr:DUF3775 domain-containing protein [Rhizomicrobium sp.]
MPLFAQGNPEDPEMPELGIAPEKVRFVIVKARQFDAKEEDSDPDEGSDAIDDMMSDVLEDKPDEDSVEEELTRFINSLDEEEQINLVALAWLGRGTYDIEEWKDAIDTARNEHNNRTAQYLLSLPLLGDYLAEGLAAFGKDFEDETQEEFEADAEREEIDKA